MVGEVQSYKAPEQEEGRTRYLTNLIKERMKDAYGTVMDEKAKVRVRDVRDGKISLSMKTVLCRVLKRG